MCSLGFLLHLPQKSGTGGMTLYPLGSELELGHQNMSSLALSCRGGPGQCCSSRQLSISLSRANWLTERRPWLWAHQAHTSQPLIPFD